ncbi:MAG: hypothetical protein PHO80_01335 [Candidatus Gracilibacteria bacterium]|nr:hypothetical protein [Candidatus Gracilibacteria bacterium]MDD4530178.1 hypothetical protein [Candidatus Gracilibacteria bacterium]
MLIKGEGQEKIFFGKNWEILDYMLPNEDIGISYQKVNGRVPESGRIKNNVCREICYITKGKGCFYVENDLFEAKKGDIIMIDTNKKSYIMGKLLEFIVITSPNWHESQSEFINND